jgi:hypothetical protein
MTDTGDDINNKSMQDTSLLFDEANFGELEQSDILPAFEFSSPISSISSNCSSPERTVQPMVHEDDNSEMESCDFVSLEELRSQISPPSDDEYGDCSTLTSRKSILETIYEDIYLETPPGTPSCNSGQKQLKRRAVRADLSKCDEFKENVQKNL